MGSTLKLVVDRQNRRLNTQFGTVAQIPDLFQSNTITLQVQVVDPGQTALQQPTVVDLAAYGMRAAVGVQPTGTAGGPTPLALQDTFTWDPNNKWFTADLALNTVGIDAAIGALASVTAWFELNLTLAGARTTILQNNFLLRAVVDELTSNVPTPTDQYLTKAESVNTFMPRTGAAGDVLTLVSPDGSKRVQIGIDNNGVFTTNFF